MPNHDYTAKEALDLLLKNIEESSTALAKQIRLAVDTGHDIQAEDEGIVSPKPKGKKVKKRNYRKHVAYTNEKALGIAITVLNSNLVESRLLVNAALGEFKQVGTAGPKQPVPTPQEDDLAQNMFELDTDQIDLIPEFSQINESKKILVEGEPETVQERANRPDVQFKSSDEHQLESLRELIQKLKSFTDFQEENYGNAK